MISKPRSSSRGLASEDERAFLKRVVDAGGYQGLTKDMARDRLASLEIRDAMQKPTLQLRRLPVQPSVEAPGKAEQPLHSGYPYYFTAEEIRMGKGERK